MLAAQQGGRGGGGRAEQEVIRKMVTCTYLMYFFLQSDCDQMTVNSCCLESKYFEVLLVFCNRYTVSEETGD